MFQAKSHGLRMGAVWTRFQFGSRQTQALIKNQKDKRNKKTLMIMIYEPVRHKPVYPR